MKPLENEKKPGEFFYNLDTRKVETRSKAQTWGVKGWGGEVGKCIYIKTEK